MSIFHNIRRAIFGYDLFISYSRKDGLDYAYAIAQYLLTRGYDCYIDQLSSISPGEKLPANIRDAVKQSTAFILVGSEGARQSAPVAMEVRLFLQNYRNRPLIPITIGDAAFDANWYGQIAGLAMIDDTKANLAAATPATDVTNRIENALGFTKKSVRLRRIAMTTALLILATVSGAAYYTYSAKKKATEAQAQESKALQQVSTAKNELIAAQRATSKAENQKAAAENQVRQATARLAELDHTLQTAKARVNLLDKKSAVQNLIYNAGIEHDLGNSNAAFKYAALALRKEKGIPGANTASAVTASLLNDLSPKYLDNQVLPYHFDSYGADRNVYITRMQVFPMRPDQLQVLDFNQEPRFDVLTRMPDDNQSYVPLCILKKYELCALSIKRDRGLVLNRDKAGNAIPLTYEAYYFGADPSGQGFESLTNVDTTDRAARRLRLVHLNADLDTTSSVSVDPSLANYLHILAARDSAGEYYYLCPETRDRGAFALSLLHPADTSKLIVVSFDPKRPAPEQYTLSHMHFTPAVATHPGYAYLKYLRVTDTSILYMARDSLYAHDRRNGRETLVMAFTDLPEECNNYHNKYHFMLERKSRMIFATDSGYRMTILRQEANGWQIFSRCRLDMRLDSMTYDVGEQMVRIYTRYTTFHIRRDQYLSEAAHAAERGFPYIPAYDNFYSGAQPNFHLERDGSLQLVDNNETEVRSTLTTAYPGEYYYSTGSHTILSVDTRNGVGKVSVSDISNALLVPDSIRDDAAFDAAKFQELPFDIQLDTTVVRDKQGTIAVSMQKLWIRAGGKEIPYVPDDAILKAGFTDRPGWIYFFTSADEISNGVVFNLYNYKDNFRYAYPLKLFKIPDAFQFTRKYIYFSQNAFTDRKQHRKLVRIVNPAIDRKDVEDILAKSIY